jgi:hypothetical protein
MIARLKPADGILGLSALAVLVLLSFDWFSATLAVPVTLPGRGPVALDVNTTGWAALGWLTVVLVTGTCLLALIVVALLASGALDSKTLAPHVALVVLAPLAFLVLLIVVLAEPGLGPGLPGEAVGIEPAAWAGLVAMALVWLASWRSLTHERKDIPDRIVTAPPPLPAPPAPRS